MNISSHSLYHFTNLNSLKGILKSKAFIPNFCLETHDNLHPDLEVYYPMVCFCDIPLSKISNHTKTYGNYGIAMKREWGIKNELNPVLYPEKNTPMSNMIANGLKESLNDNGIAKIIKPLMAMTKTRIGKMYRHSIDNYVENVNFYNEREWRYVPFNFEPLFEFKSPIFDYKIIENQATHLSRDKTGCSLLIPVSCVND